LPKPYVERQCNEIMMLGLQGVTILVASGDYGVVNLLGGNNNAEGCLSAHRMKGTTRVSTTPTTPPDAHMSLL